MESRVGVGRAIGGDQQLSTVKVGGVGGHQFDLHRPLAQLAGGRFRRSSGGFGIGVQGLGHTAGAAAEGAGRTAGAGVGRFMLLGSLHGGLVVGHGLALHKSDGPGGAVGQAVAKAVAVIVPHQMGFAVDHGNGALMASVGAGAAAVALGLINFNNSSFHHGSPCILLLSLL